MISKDSIGTLTGPYVYYSHPFGRGVSRFTSNHWFIETPTGVYGLEQFPSQLHRFILSQSYPTIERKTLKNLIKFVMAQKKRIVLCT